MNNTNYIRQRLLNTAHERDSDSYTALCISEWCDEFEQLMRNRLIMGSLRYGKLGSPNKPQYNRMDSIQRRVEKYIKTGNLEHLVDIANISLVEFVEGNHTKKHFNSIDDGEHTRRKT